MKSQRELINELVEAIIDNGHRRGIGALNDEQRVVFLVVHLETLTCMEGLAGFYHHCQGGAQAVAAADALQSIGADQSANLIRQANALFPDGQPPLDQAKLDESLNNMGVAVYDAINALGIRFLAYPDGFQLKLDAFVLGHVDKLSEGL